MSFKKEPYTLIRILDKRDDTVRKVCFYTRLEALQFIAEHANRETDVIILIKTYDHTQRFYY